MPALGPFYPFSAATTANKNAVSGFPAVDSSLFNIRPSRWFSASSQEVVASLKDVGSYIQSGDGMWYSGTRLHSWLIRIATISNVSHAGLYGREGPTTSDLFIYDVIEGTGGRRVSLEEEVSKYPGCYIWAPVDRKHFPDFDGEAAINEMAKLVGTKYGRIALLYEALFHMPFLREIAYALWHHHIDENWKDVPPYCSMAQKLACVIGGGYDPVPGRAAQLTTPQDTMQSLLWTPLKVALVP